eukprot:GHVS01037113.1.p1 GENE.GHVS01037113.1~~GHVS01037113.1.p1  ORF type:complete len:276 (-),score=51.99 GHVS01037113.1:534-1361(-)
MVFNLFVCFIVCINILFIIPLYSISLLSHRSTTSAHTITTSSQPHHLMPLLLFVSNNNSHHSISSTLPTTTASSVHHNSPSTVLGGGTRRVPWSIKTPSLLPAPVIRVPEKSIFPYHFLTFDYSGGYDGIFGLLPPPKASSADGQEGKDIQLLEEKKAEDALTAVKRNPIRLYISPCCPFCDKVMGLLHQNGRLEKLEKYGMVLTPIRDIEDIYVVNIDGNRLIEKTGGKVQVPALELENRVMVYESVVIMKLLSTYLRVKERLDETNNTTTTTS